MSILDQWEAEAATLRNSLMIMGDDMGEKHDAIYEDQKRILLLIDLIRKKDQLMNAARLTNGERFSLEKKPNEFFEWSCHSQHRINEALELTEDLK